MPSMRQHVPITNSKALANVVWTKAHFERELHLSRLPHCRTSLTVEILGTAEEGAVKQRMEEVSPQGPSSPLFKEKRKLAPAPQSSHMPAPLAVKTRDAHGSSGPPLHQLAIRAPAPRQNDDSIRLELTQRMVKSVDVDFSAVGQFSLDRPEALLGKPVLAIQTADVSLLTSTKDHHVMFGPKILHR